jgi:hypothetical protein
MDIDVMKKALNAQSNGVIFLIMALVGAIMALLTSLMPLLIAHLLPALIILICALMFYLWKGAGKSVKMTLAIVALLMGLWLVINMALQIVLPPIPTEDLMEQITAGVKAGFTLYFGGVGGLITLVGSIFGIVAAKG